MANDDAAAEAEFQRLRASGRNNMLLEIASFEALEVRCGQLHAKLCSTIRQIAGCKPCTARTPTCGSYAEAW